VSTFEDDRYRWRETYFVLFSSSNRPGLKTVEKKLAALDKRYLLSNPSADSDGLFESLTLMSPDDFAAMDICYTSGTEVLEQISELVEDISATADPVQRKTIKRLRGFDGRFDVLHFEQISDLPAEEDENDELLDPSALLAVLDALSKLTGGVAIDPQSGTILGED
jgi:hypothetical protein